MKKMKTNIELRRKTTHVKCKRISGLCVLVMRLDLDWLFKSKNSHWFVNNTVSVDDLSTRFNLEYWFWHHWLEVQRQQQLEQRAADTEKECGESCYSWRGSRASRWFFIITFNKVLFSVETLSAMICGTTPDAILFSAALKTDKLRF